jgi:hypothetical protein
MSLFELGILAAIVAVGYVLFTILARRYFDNASRTRAQLSPGDFEADFTGISPQIVHAVRTYFESFAASKTFPVRAADDIREVFLMDDEEFALEMSGLAEHCGFRDRPPRWLESVITVGDLIRRLDQLSSTDADTGSDSSAAKGGASHRS